MTRFESEEEHLIDRGRRIVRGVVTWSVLNSAVTIVTFNLSHGRERLPTQIVRFVLTCALAWFVARGRGWARWLSVVLWSLGGVGSLVGAFLASSGPNLRLVVMGVGYLVCAVLVVAPASVNRFFESVATGPSRVERPDPTRPVIERGDAPADITRNRRS